MLSLFNFCVESLASSEL